MKNKECFDTTQHSTHSFNIAVTKRIDYCSAGQQLDLDELARSWRISADIYPAWESVKYIIDKNLYLAAYADEGHYNDMDMLEIGRGLTPAEKY